MYYLPKAFGEYSIYGLAFKGPGFYKVTLYMGMELSPGLVNVFQGIITYYIFRK
jgi:hypothetical protein